MYAIELVEYLLDIFFLDALTVILDAEAQMLAFVPSANVDVDRLIGLAIFHRVIQQVGDGIGEVHLVNEDG